MKKIYWFVLLLFAVSCDKDPLVQLTDEPDLMPKIGRGNCGAFLFYVIIF